MTILNIIIKIKLLASLGKNKINLLQKCSCFKNSISQKFIKVSQIILQLEMKMNLLSFNGKLNNNSNSIIEMHKLMYFKQSRNDKGHINLILFIDFKLLCLLPILLIKHKLLAPLFFTHNCIKAIQLYSKMLYDFNRSHHTFLVKEFLFNELNNNCIEIYFDNSSVLQLIKYSESTKIKKEVPFIYKINEENFINKYYSKSGVYIIYEDIKNQSYIGSSINIKNRYNSHKKDLIPKKFYPIIDQNLPVNKNTDYKYHIKLGALYFTKDYYKEFKGLYPDYKLSKGEWLILNKLTDLHLKLLEQSLLIKFKHVLNEQNNVVYRFSEWRKEWLYYYDNEFEYKKASKVIVYRKIDFRSKFYTKYHLSKNVIYEIEMFNDAKTFSYLNDKFKLNNDIILNNINKMKYIDVDSQIFNCSIRIQEPDFHIEKRGIITLKHDYLINLITNKLKQKYIKLNK